MTLGDDRSFFGHPSGLAILFLTEMWERFGFYGMRALLILYLTAAAAEGGLGMDVPTAGAIYALFTSLVYFLGLPGGWVAERFLGQRRAVRRKGGAKWTSLRPSKEDEAVGATYLIRLMRRRLKRFWRQPSGHLLH